MGLYIWASVYRAGLDKIMNIYLVNAPKLESTFGKDAICKKVNVNKSAGVNHVSISLDLCKLRGIDLEALIKAHPGRRTA